MPLYTKNGKSSKNRQHIKCNKYQEQKRGHPRGTERRTVHFTTLMDVCHLKNSELEPKFQKYKGRVVLRIDIVKDDSGSSAPLTEQGSLASQMTAAKVMDVKAKLPGCTSPPSREELHHFSSRFFREIKWNPWMDPITAHSRSPLTSCSSLEALFFQLRQHLFEASQLFVPPRLVPPLSHFFRGSACASQCL